MNQMSPDQMQEIAARFPPAVSSGWFYVPYQAFGSEQAIRDEKQRLTFRPKFAEPGDPPILMYRDLPSRGYLGVPRSYGQHRFSWLNVDDRRSLGVVVPAPPRLPDPNHPAVKEPVEQGAFMRNMLNGIESMGNFTAKAPTGSGKTVVALWTHGQLLRRTVILVPLERIMHQWIEEISDKLGLPEDRIGMVQGPRCVYEGKDVVVAMMHSLSQRNDYPSEFYRSIGNVFIDEGHRVGSALLSRTCSLFSARNRVALTATPKRKDEGERILYWHVGPVMVTSKARALECTIYVKRYRTNRKLYGRDATMRAKCLAADPERNAMLVDLIRRNHAIGRQMLIIGKFVEHLQDLMDMCEMAGVPRADMGQYTAQYLVRTRVSDGKGGTKWKIERRAKTSKAQFDYIKANSQLIFATYGMFKEAIDVPRLDCGIDVLPQSDATQVLGRILRPKDGKPMPYWITPLDVACTISQRQFEKRCKDYREAGARIVDNGKV